MNQLTVQFNRSDFEIECFNNERTLPFSVDQLDTIDNKMLLEQQRANGQLLARINHGIEQIFDNLNQIQQEIEITTLHFAESFTRMVFENDSELVIKKLKSLLATGTQKFPSSIPLTIHVHPEFVNEINDVLAGQENLNVMPDSLLEKSDCRIEGPECGWISMLETQLETCRQVVFEKLNTVKTDTDERAEA